MISRPSEDQRAEPGFRVTPALQGSLPGSTARTKAVVAAAEAAPPPAAAAAPSAAAAQETATQAMAVAQAQGARKEQAGARMQCPCPPPAISNNNAPLPPRKFLTTRFGVQGWAGRCETWPGGSGRDDDLEQ